MNPDFLKVVVVLAAFIYLHFKLRPHISAINLSLMSIGLFLLLFASVLDFSDGFKCLDNVAILGKNAPYHDFLEDQIGDTPGLTFLLLGAFREFMAPQKRRS